MQKQNKVILPLGYTEPQIIQIIERIVNKLAPLFIFGSHNLDDIKQQGRYEAWKAITEGKFDPNRGNTLDNFLFAHVKNRLNNFKRDNFSRQENPCPDCPLNSDLCHEHGTKSMCERWQKWLVRNEHKRQLSYGYTVEDEVGLPKVEKDVVDTVSVSELQRKIDEQLPISFRSDYLRWLNHVKIPKARQDKLIEKLKEIAGES